MKCNGDCFNCIYDDCILDEEECYENREYYQDMDNYVLGNKDIDYKAKYISLRKRLYYYTFRDVMIAYQKQYNKQHWAALSEKYKRWYICNRGWRLEHQRSYYARIKKSYYIDWYNKYLKYKNMPIIKNPYKKKTPEEMLEISKKELDEFLKLHPQFKPRVKHEKAEKDIEEKIQSKERTKQYHRRLMNSIFKKRS